MVAAGLNLSTFTKCQPPLTTLKYFTFLKIFSCRRLFKVSNNKCTILSYDKWDNLVAYKVYFFISLLTRRCSVGHHKVKINYLQKKVGHWFSNMLISKTYILSFETWEKMVADNSKMASSLLFSQIYRFSCNKLNF